ncbi:coiled-coil domain-containing protein 177-like [Cherax quadricarinatus]|uniref:coiled-coil domain-containing protein 177-like n=1 Tax=Cherax quadricarinatus TaxID=27406 RepID=UPI00387EAD94
MDTYFDISLGVPNFLKSMESTWKTGEQGDACAPSIRDKQASAPSTKNQQASALSVIRKPRTGAPRPSSAQRVKQAAFKPVFNAASKRADTHTIPTFTRIPGEPYRASVGNSKPGSSKFTPGKLTRPYSASEKTRLSTQHKQHQLQHTNTSLLQFEGTTQRPTAAADTHRPHTTSRLPPASCGTWPGGGSTGRQAAGAAHPPPAHRPRITWASQPPRYHGTRRSSDSTASLASSLSDLTDDGVRSANSAAECDRQDGDSDDDEEEASSGLLRESPSKRPTSAYRATDSIRRIEPSRLSVSVVSSGGSWTPRSDTTTLTPASTPRLQRRRTPTPAHTSTSAPRTPVRRRPFPHRRVSSARPATSTSPVVKLTYTGSLDEIAGVRGDGGSSLGLHAGPTSLELPRPSSATVYCPSYRLSRPSSALARTQSQRRPGSSTSGGTWSPRLLPQHRSLSTVSLADSQILAKFMDGLENTEVPARDLRILELLAMKHEKLYAEEQRSYMAHRTWLLQKEREQKEAAAQWTEWRLQVNEKRRQENQENLRRWQRTEEVYLQSQENLFHLISSKERRAREILSEQHQARMRRLEERRASECARKAAQETALKLKEEAEERKRQHLIQLWEQQQQLVEQRRREREEFFRKRVEEGNWVEAEQQEARRKQVEARGEALLEAMKINMEERLARAHKNLQMLNDMKEDTIRRHRDERERRSRAVRALHHQLEAAMMQWRQHVLRRQLDSMAAAEARQELYLNTRASRIQADRTSRSHHQQQLLQQVMAREEAELQIAKKNLEAKDLRSLGVSRERERQVCRARTTALTTAALRENLRKKLSPETFDKVVARANLELRIENRPPATSSIGSRSHIFLG